MTRGAVSKILDKLSQKKWIKRSAAAEDKRVQLLSLTAAGMQVIPRLARVADENDHRFFDCLTPQERSDLLRLLEKLSDVHQLVGAPLD